MDEFEVVLRVENPQRVIVEWPERMGDEFHRLARELILGVSGVDAVGSTVYREVVQVAPHVAVAEVVAQDLANAFLDDSGAFYGKWRALGYREICTSVQRW